MGCDIHMFVERLTYQWDEKTQDERKVWAMMMHEDMAFDDRNYHLFALLAGVRNNNDVLPISKPRGFPVDVSFQVKGELDNADIHSVSYFTLGELLRYPWDQMTQRSGIVHAVTAARLIGGERPTSWCRGIAGPGIRVVTESEMRDLLAQHPIPQELMGVDPLFGRLEGHPLNGVHAQMSWDDSDKETCQRFIDWLQVVKTSFWNTENAEDDNDKALDTVRLVFGFDN